MTELAKMDGRWDDDSSWWELPNGEHFILPDSVRDAILTTHPEVVALRTAALDVRGKLQRGRIGITAYRKIHERHLRQLDRALAQWDGDGDE